MKTTTDARAIKAVIFDLDNTLTDFMKAKSMAIHAAADAMIDAGLSLKTQQVYDRIFAIYDEVGIEHQLVFNRFLEDETGGVDDRVLAAAVVAYRRAREAHLVPYPHVRPTLLALLKGGYKLAVVSDAPRFEAWLRLCYLRLLHVFDVVLTHDDTGHTKPSPVPFQMALERLGVTPRETVMIGDWPERDIVGGLDAGLHTVYARYGDTYGLKDCVKATVSGAHFEIDDLSQLLGVIDSLNAAGGEA
ncbi:HAD-IA family hydrolase [bacterium]|nr:HAD-IA family hydrolase [bacterium]MBU1072705.1 HAD-IA family hydrolase [bacterium]MBU1677125.1 HAD-IA family hydrolase [bacterium]